MILITLWLRWAFMRSAYQILVGRDRDRTKPHSGRFFRGQVDHLLAGIWRHMDKLLPGANLFRRYLCRTRIASTAVISFAWLQV